ncbi:hypothetical protein HELRODRAFT_187829 [Helobdella robusta]|uniref:Uncharacterized protein n=1 Tax=Helobdella robusta TaxID=6412 RepID=T1FPE8_HELRO|nr:hypothetical protein HELRODRAFT_187829 [Helobdella robusta]ESO12312.1 hypothetical protein HELRODRAFT_187829 [Helobdella robusta]
MQGGLAKEQQGNYIITVWNAIDQSNLKQICTELVKCCSMNQSDVLLAFENLKLESEFQFNKARIIMTEEQKCDMKRCLLANNASSSNPFIPFKKLSFRDADCISSSSSFRGRLPKNEADRDEEEEEDDHYHYNRTGMKFDYKKRHNIYKRSGSGDDHPCSPRALLERMLRHAYYKTNERTSSEKDIDDDDVDGDQKVCDGAEDSGKDGNDGKQATSPPSTNSNNTLERKRKSSNEKFKDDDMDASVADDDDDMFNNEIKKKCLERRRDNDVCDDVIMNDHGDVDVDHNDVMEDDIGAASDHNITDDSQMKDQQKCQPDGSPNNIYNEENTEASKNQNKTPDSNDITNDNLVSNFATKQNASSNSPVITESLNNKPPQTTQSFDSDMPSLDESSFWMDGVVVTPTTASSVGVTSLSPSPPDLKKENPNSEHSVIKYDAGVELSVRSDQSELDVGGPTAYSPIKNQNYFPNSVRNTLQEMEDEQWSNSVKNNSEDDDCTVVAVERAAGSVSETSLKCASHAIQPSHVSSCQRNDHTVVDRNSFSYPYSPQQQEPQLPILPFPVYRNIINDNSHPVGDAMMNRHLHNLQQPQKAVYKHQNVHASSQEYCSNDAYMKKTNYSPEDVVNARPLDSTNFSRQCQSVAPSVGGAIQKSNRAKKSSKTMNEINANDIAKNSGSIGQERCSSVFSDVHTGSQYDNQTIFNGNQMMTQHQLANNEVGHHSRSAIYHDLMNHNRPATRCGLETTTFSQHQQFTSSNFPSGMSQSQRLLHLNNNNHHNNNHNSTSSNNNNTNNKSNISGSLLYLNNASNSNNNNVINNPNSQNISQMECMISNNNKQHDLLLQQQRQQQAAYLNPAAYFAKLHQFHSEFTHPLQYSSFFTHSTSPSPIDMTLHLPAPRPTNIGARKNASSSLSLQQQHQQHQQHQHTRESMMSNIDVLPPYKVANFNPYAGGSVVVDPRNLIQRANPAAIFNQQQNVASSMLPDSLNNNNNNNNHNNHNNNNKQSDLQQQSNYSSYSNGSRPIKSLAFAFTFGFDVVYRYRSTAEYDA